ncbi:MAG: TauD/TfdA family dioxygenase [bacterium]|nr:TauD/TfdA family dioxygenase [bacterium]
MEVTPLEGAFGVELRGIDLSRATRPEDAALLRKLLLEHRLVVARDQDLDPPSLRDLGASLGPLDRHPFIEAVPGHPEVIAVVKEPDEKHNFGGGWHSEVSFYEEPAMATMLYAVEVPEVGGDTLLADAVLAYEALPDVTKARIRDLEAEHSAEHIYGPGGFYQGRSEGKSEGTKTKDVAQATGRVRHPIVRTHPETGEKILYVNGGFVVGIAGLPTEESIALRAELVEHSTRDEFVTRLKWNPGTLAFWDNRSTQHYALNDYAGHRREMLRVVVAGDRPV